MNRRAALILLSPAIHASLASTTCFATSLASHSDLIRIFRSEKFQLIHHARQISTRDWTEAGVQPEGRSITASMVDPGQWYQTGDTWIGNKAIRQLLVAAKSTRYEVLCFWEGGQGGPGLSVMILKRDTSRPTLIFHAIM